MPKYKAIYKCRLCGGVYESGKPVHENAAEMAMLQFNIGITGLLPDAPRMTDTHLCGGQFAGSMGLAVFQGYKQEE